jgi:hypothetical protein
MTRIRVAAALPLVCLLGFAALVSCSFRAAPASVRPAPSQATARVRTTHEEAAAAAVLREWDERRAAAYAAGAVAALRSLYQPGSVVARADVRLLKGYLDRGLVVTGMRMQVLSLEVQRATGSLLRVRVTDRLVGAEARGSTGVLPLPRDSPTTRVVTLRRVEGEWRVVSVG